MATIEKQITINAPVDRVFSYVADFPRHSEWARQPLKIEATGPIQQGSKFKSVGKQFGEHEDEVTVTEFVPNQKLAFESMGDAGHLRHAFTLAGEGGGTRLTKSVEPVKLAGMAMLMSPILKMFLIPQGVQSDLQRIKEKIEGG